MSVLQRGVDIVEDWGRLYLRVVELYKERGKTVPEEVKDYSSKQLLKLIETLEKGEGNDESKS